MQHHKRYLSLGLMISVLTMSTSFVYAIENPANTPSTNNNSSCNACSNTSPYIDKYLEFGDEIIKTMLTYANKNISLVATKNNPTVSTQASTQTKGGSDFTRELASIADNLNKKAQTVVSAGFVATLITLETAFLDSWKSIGPMTQNQAIMRDWTKLDTLGQKIMNTLLDLGNQGVFIRLGFKDGFQERVNDIILRYSTGDNVLFNTYERDSFSYAPADVLSALWSMNQGLKSAIGVGSKDELYEMYLKEQISFSQAMQNELGGVKDGPKSYYACAQRIQGMKACSALGSQAAESAKAILKDTKKETKNATKIVKDAVKRLNDFWAKNGETKTRTARQDDYLRSQIGLQGVRNNEGDPLVGGFRESWKAIRDEVSASSPFIGLKKNPNAKQGSTFTVGDIASELKIQVNKDTISDAINDTLNIAKANWDTALLGQVDPVSKVFPLVTQEIMSAKYKIDAASAKSIVQSLGKACDAQCSNVGGKCRSSQ